MSKFCIILAALLFVQLSSAGIARRDAPEPKPAPTLDEIVAKTTDVFKQANEEFLKFIGVETNEQLIEKIQSETKTFVNTAKTQFDELAKQVDNEKTQEFVGNLKKQLDELTKENPAITADAKALNEQFQTSLQKVVKETQKLSTKLHSEGSHVGEDVEKLLKTIVDSTVDAAKKLTAKKEEV